MRPTVGGGKHVGARGIALGLAALLTSEAIVVGQYVDGGEVSVTCTICSCEGSSEAGPIVVLDNPSTGNRMVSVDGEYSYIAETSCGTSAFAVDSTIYDLSGVDLIPREFEVVNMTADGDCATNSVPSADSDCYSGEVARSLSDGLSMTMALCLCVQPADSSSTYSSRVDVTVIGASEASFPSVEVELCINTEFISQLVTVAVEGDTYWYNLDLAVPGEDSSATLPVAPAPDASAQAFICGEEGPEPEPDTAAPSPSPTPSSVTSSPSLPPTLGPAARSATDAPETTPATDAPGAAVEDPFIDGGEVSVTCTSCSCEGTSDAGPIMVLDNPSTGNRMVSVDGEYSDIAETSCGTSAFAVDSTIYELSGVDLIPREFEVVNMTADGDCATNSVPPADSDCYSGEVARGLSGGLSMTMTLCLCVQPADSYSTYSSQVDVTVIGASEVSLPSDELELCLETGFFSQLVTVAVEGGTYWYNLDLAVPGADSSSTLQVASAPNASAQAFICGEEASETEPAAATTPSPIATTVTTAPAASPAEEAEVATASASTTGGTSGTSGASPSLSRRIGGGSGGGGGVGVAAVAAVLGGAWLSFAGVHGYMPLLC